MPLVHSPPSRLTGMSSVGNDKLLQAVFEGNFDAVVAAIEAGARVCGPPEEHCTPIAAATIAHHVAMVEFFLRQGADPDRPLTVNRPIPESGMGSAFAVERALHI